MNPIAGPIPTSHASEIVAVPLRIPGPYRVQNGRTAASQTNLLPVFLAGEENAFAAFVCNNLGSAYSTPDVEQPEAAPSTSDNQPAISDWPELVPLLLIGPQGCGKTAIASHLAAILLDAAPSVPAGAESVAKEPAAMFPTRNRSRGGVGCRRRPPDGQQAGLPGRIGGEDRVSG
jgi:hypothetical protein